MANKCKVTESKWKAIKILLESGATYKEIGQMMDVSNSIISFSKSSETYEEFRHKVYVTSGAYRKKIAAEEKRKQEEAELAKREKEKKAAEVAKKINAVSASELVKEEPKVVKEDRQTIVVQASHYMLEEQKKTNELLTVISNKLAMIITDLYGVKE